MKIEVGSVLKAQGIKGEIKLSCFLDNAAMLCGLKKLYIGTQTYAVEQARTDGAFCYLKLSGVSDRNAAESLKGWTVCADKDSVPLPKGRYFVKDLVGCSVVTESGKLVGTVTDILQYGAADVFVCRKDGKNLSFPFLKDVVLSVDTDRKTVTLNETRFNEVAVYED